MARPSGKSEGRDQARRDQARRDQTRRDQTRRDQTRRDQIERNLKRVYDETLREPLPDKLADLLEQIRKQGRE